MYGSRTAIAVALLASGCVSTALAQAQSQPTAVEIDVPAPAVNAEARMAAVLRHVEAYQSRNLDRFVSTFTPDAEVYALGQVARGHKEIRALYRLNFAPGAPEIRVMSTDASELFVFLEVAYLMKNGEEICCSQSEYEVRDGKISYLSATAP